MAEAESNLGDVIFCLATFHFNGVLSRFMEFSCSSMEEYRHRLFVGYVSSLHGIV